MLDTFSVAMHIPVHGRKHVQCVTQMLLNSQEGNLLGLVGEYEGLVGEYEGLVGE